MNKRPLYVEDLVQRVNRYLRFHKITNASDTLFGFMVYDYLQQRGYYKGYNFFKDTVIGDKVVPTLAGSCKDGEYEYLQIL